MYLHHIQHKDEFDKVIALQMRGFLFESHCWVDEGGWPRTCKWCGAVAKRDMKMKGQNEITLCPKNPAIKDLINAIQGLADVVQKCNPDKTCVAVEIARALLKRNGVEL